MRTRTAALIISALGVTSAFAADVAPSAEPMSLSSTASPVAIAAPQLRDFKPKGRMPVRGLGHLVAVYGTAVIAEDESPPHLAEQANNAPPPPDPSCG